MRIAVTGSIATDHLMVFPGKFSEQFVVDQLDKVSLSFLVDQLEVRRGGVAANICYGLGSLGMNPILVGAVGADFDEYRAWLERHGVDTKSVHVSRTKHTSRFLCTTDQVQAQIATFYAGAMEEARDIELRPIADRVGGLDLVIVAPNDPQRWCGTPSAAHWVSRSPPTRRNSWRVWKVRAARSWKRAYLFTNKYETSLLLKETGWSESRCSTGSGTG